MVLCLLTPCQNAFGTLEDRGCAVPGELSHLSNYNCPEKHGHKRKTADSLKSSEIREHSTSILHLVESTYMKALSWTSVRKILKKLSVNLRKYADYLDSQNTAEQESHSKAKMSFFPDDKSMFQQGSSGDNKTNIIYTL